MERRTPDAEAQRLAEAGESIGAYLAQQRRLRGISSEELSELTRIPLRSIERLESGSFDCDPDGFVRGFVRTVAEAVGLDPDDTVARMLSEPEVSGRSHGRPRLAAGRVALVGVAVAVVAATIGVVRIVATSSRGGAAAPDVRSEQVTRRDPVRALAEAHAASSSEAPGGESEAPGAPTEPPPVAAPGVAALR